MSKLKGMIGNTNHFDAKIIGGYLWRTPKTIRVPRVTPIGVGNAHIWLREIFRQEMSYLYKQEAFI